MRRIALLCILASVLGVGAGHAEMRVMFINSEVVLQQARAVQDAVETFNRDVEGWNEEAQRQKGELDALQQELENQSLMLSDERRQEREIEYQRRLTEYEQFVQSIWGPAGLVEQRNEELLRPILSRIEDILAQIAAEEGYDMILDAADNNILYADPDYDLTSRVVETLNAEEAAQ
jgi:outer membrane protein